ncbi:uncharacterized protein LOC118194160, partial [Stegodyphus dumicola]|uniref:uncharacterized protein LOC118194160 n=1 Tax=Stegodyphus dumicola TaxID=202533 RepID=UPI0015AD1B8E
MGACYSKKASGGNRSYTTVHMASTKLEEASRLARPTPYSRTQNANIEYAAKKSIPLSTKHSSVSTVDPGEIKNLKNSFQSNIPRFSSSLPSTTSLTAEQKTNIPNYNDNETLHVVNNNPIINSRSAVNITNNASPPVNKVAKTESQFKPKSLGSKSCPDKIVNQDVSEEKQTRIPGKGTGLPRQYVAVSKSAHSVSHLNTESLAVPKSQQTKDFRGVGSRNSSSGQSPQSKSPSRKGFESHDSLSDFDSGIGNSLNEKIKPEDSDTIKDLEHLELQDDSSPVSIDTCSTRSTSTPKYCRSETKMSVKAPTYKREPNGKWSFDEKHFGPETERSVVPKPFSSSGGSSPREKHSFKISASENIFSTYASYKGLLSYQKKSCKPLDCNSYNSREKTVSEQMQRIAQPQAVNSSCIPKMRRQLNQPLSGGNSVFYIQNESEKSVNEEKPKTVRKTSEYQTLNSKQSSLDSDEKSDSTENGVLSPPSEVENREFLIDDEISDQPGLTFFGEPRSEESDMQSLQLAVTELHALQMASSSKKRTDSVGSYCSRKSRTGDHRDSLLLGSDLGSSCSSIASDDLMLDYEKTFDNTFPEGTVNEGPASPMRKISETDDKIAPLRIENKIDFEDKNRKRLQRRSSGPFSSSAERLEWRHRTVSLPLRPPRQMSISEADDGSLKLDSSSYRLLCQDLNGVKTLLLRLKSVIQEAETINPFDQANPK